MSKDRPTNIAASFDRRQTPLPRVTPLALSDEFANDAQKQIQWKAFLNKNKLVTSEANFRSITSQLELFLMPVVNSLEPEIKIDFLWPPGGPWTNQPSS